MPSIVMDPFGIKYCENVFGNWTLMMPQGSSSVIVFMVPVQSTCPVTNQPDWATVTITYSGQKMSESRLLAYLISYRNHQGFHDFFED